MRLETLLDQPLLKLALFPVLWPASLLYGAGVAFDRARGSRNKSTLSVPTISVGNLSLGGTGKTPVLLRVLSELYALNRRPLVLTRGYAGAGQARKEGVVKGTGASAGFSDEVALMAEHFPDATIVAAADRAAGGARALAQGAGDVAVLDDGFQHWPLHRDLDIVCVDGTNPWGGGLLPWGRLREPATALSRAHIVVITRCESLEPEAAARLAAHAASLAPSAEIYKSRFSLELISPAAASSQTPRRAIAASGIGNPAAFETNLESMGVDVVPVRFPDHHAYSTADAASLSKQAAALKCPVIVTEKDWVKLRALPLSAPVLVARQTLHFDDGAQSAWRRRIAAAVGR